MENYIGKIVFVDTGKDYPRGQEIVVVKQSPNRIFGVPTIAGYSGHEFKGYDLIGPNAATIVSSSETSRPFLEKLQKEHLEFANEPNVTGKKQWVDYVYEGARRNARYLQELIDSYLVQSPEVETAIPNKQKISDHFLELARIFQEMNL